MTVDGEYHSVNKNMGVEYVSSILTLIHCNMFMIYKIPLWNTRNYAQKGMEYALEITVDSFATQVWGKVC